MRYCFAGRRRLARSVPTMMVPVKSTILNRFPIISLGQRAAGNFEWILLIRSERGDQMRQHEVL